jgi:uncharacterized membrane protein
MPLFLWLATFLGSLFSSVVAFFMQYVTKRLAIVLAVISAIAALTLGFFAAILALVNAVSSVTPPYFSVAMSWIVPSNAPLCISTILTAHLIRWVYEWNVKVIQLRLF